MKKVYETPACQLICMAEEDILTASFIEFSKNENGNLSDGFIIEW